MCKTIEAAVAAEVFEAMKAKNQKIAFRGRIPTCIFKWSL